MEFLIELLKYWKNKNLNLADAFQVAYRNRVLKKPVQVVPLILGSSIHLRGDESSDIKVFRQICVEREYDLHFDFPITRIIDGGANCGFTSLFYRKKYPDADIVSIEPEPSNVEAFRKNVGQLDRITFYPNALHGRKCQVKIDNPDCKSQWAFKTAECSEEESSIETVTIPEIMHAKGWGYIDILKVDIEGGEIELFSEGDLEWIQRINVIIIEFHDRIRKGTAQAFFKSLSAMDAYDFETHRESVIITRRNLLS